MGHLVQLGGGRRIHTFSASRGLKTGHGLEEK